MRWLGSAHSKGLKCGRLRLKTGKTRCLFGTAHSKGLKGIVGEGERAAGEISELGDRGRGIGVSVRKGWASTNTEEDSIP
jgi:hypothetical protein